MVRKIKKKGIRHMYIEVDGLNIHYKITGGGERTLVILQGWGTSLQVYETVAACVEQEYRTVRFDFPGFGDSEEPGEPWSVEAYTSFFIDFMQELGIKKASLLGHSYGGRVIIRLTARENLPFVIEKIVLVDSAGILPQRSFRQRWRIKKYRIMKRLISLKPVYLMMPELIEEWKSRQGSEDYRNASPVMRQALVMAVNEDLTNLLSGIQQETLLIWGDQDQATPLRDGELMEKKIPGSGLVTLKGAGHYCFLDQPQVFRRVMESFFAIGKRETSNEDGYFPLSSIQTDGRSCSGAKETEESR